MTPLSSKAGRRYSGLDAGQRSAARRESLFAAALELFGTKGYSATSVKQICVEAELTERYFYESFTDRHAALTAVYLDIIDQVRAAVLAALEEVADTPDQFAARGLAVFIEYLTSDPRRAQIVMIEVVGVSPDLEKCRYGVLRDFADLMNNVGLVDVRDDVSTGFAELTAVALAGAVNYLLVDWLLGGRKQEPAELVAVCTALFEAAVEKLR